ncbi:uncharacterized protein HD556DRAFT_465119 [Suillus plorans]|uniref:Uncharacterized protein n=1 Tax=Suillus plorans TaxID=116603 RepID=A0A9P7APC6_9AGAM|nr:uncharacterized protein HD556DRAFT_465119 [Suillus plorans]KAG1793614.1 hypothetical protein HD556DRAFT_465119 [Suillus plorans]
MYDRFSLISGLISLALSCSYSGTNLLHPNPHHFSSDTFAAVRTFEMLILVNSMALRTCFIFTFEYTRKVILSQQRLICNVRLLPLRMQVLVVRSANRPRLAPPTNPSPGSLPIIPGVIFTVAWSPAGTNKCIFSLLLEQHIS